MKESINCAILGLGRLGYWHACNLAKIKGANLTCVVDPLEGRAEQAARELGAEKWSQDVEDIIKDDNIEAVVIVTPTSTHAELLTKMADAKKHIFVEKPLTQYVSEADQVIDVIRKNQVFCQVGFMRRFDPDYAEAKRRIQNGDIGQPLYFKGVSRDGNIPPVEFLKNSGGIFLDLAIHEYDIARYLLDQEISEIHSTGSVLLHSFMKDLNDADSANSYLTFDQGAAGDIEASWIAHNVYDVRGEVIGSEGAIQIGSMRRRNINILNKSGSRHELISDFPAKFKDAYYLEVEHFIDSLRKSKAPLCNEIDGRIALEAAAAATKSFHTNKPVKLQAIYS
ncbi:Gfo/Idh/MocA family oxidoreductase [Alteribacillus bidgolensis]|nr:Gfo/Idh/MocA family oxidoreductase [Alteribacillus bidgolensis]